MKRWIRRLVIVALGLVALWCGVGAVLALLPVSGFDPAVPAPASGTPQVAARPGGSDSAFVVEFQAKDGLTLRARRFAGDGPLTVLLLPGVVSEAHEYDLLATRLVAESSAEVLTLDLRGHGRSDGKPGDVSFIGQYGHDVAAVLAELKERRPDRKLILAGYSMGGGIALRYAEEALTPPADGYLLLAPLMGPDSPTSRREPAAQESGAREERHQESSGMILHVRRLIGLVMLNTVGFSRLNSLPTLEFQGPPDSTTSYSFRAMVGMTPSHHASALTADAAPLLVLVGSEDPVFQVDQFPPVIALHENGSTQIIDGIDHDGLIHASETAARAGLWLRTLTP